MVTCQNCKRVNRLGTANKWTVPCRPGDPRSRQKTALFWKTLISSQKELLASAWGSTVDDVDAYYEHISHDAHVGVRIGEAKNPRPRVRASQRLRRPSKIWTCNTGGAPKTWPLLSLLKTHQPHVVMLQEAAFKPIVSGPRFRPMHESVDTMGSSQAPIRIGLMAVPQF